MGKVVYSKEINILSGNTDIKLELDKLNSGICFVQVLYENTFRSIKFVKN